MKNIIIIGGGASAVITAIEASKNKNYYITIIEANNKLLKKLLITGNGKCNYTNLNFKDKSLIKKNDFKIYYNNDFFYNAFLQFSNIDLINYFNNKGLLSCEFEKLSHKYIYPITKNSKSLYYLLIDNLKKNNINIKLNEVFKSFIIKNNKFYIETNKSNYDCDILVLSGGGISYYKEDNINYIYNTLKKNNINIIKPLPALSSLITNDKLFNKIKCRLNSLVKLYIDNILITTEFGEIQINDNTISGIPILNLSAKVVKAISDNKQVYIVLNLISNTLSLNNKNDTSTHNLTLYLLDLKRVYNDLTINQVLSYLVDNSLISIILDRVKIKNNLLNVLSNNDIERISEIITEFKIDIDDYSNIKLAQITQGGVDINEINDMTFESKQIKNLYFTGELIDVCGICGGYNLQFAFTSGYVVGNSLSND